MAELKKDPKVAINDKSFISDYGYSKDVTNADKPGFVQQDSSDLHNTVSLNDLDSQGNSAIGQTYANTFNVPSKNNALGLNNTPTSTLSRNGGISSLYGADPAAKYQDRQDLI